MADVIIVGDGPGGLSAALFLARAGKEVVVYGLDKTAMHAAMLWNYPGIEQLTGTEFQAIARRQVEAAGAQILEDRVTGISGQIGEFSVSLASGATAEAGALVLSEGRSPKLALSLGAEQSDGAIVVDNNNLTTVPGVYAVGRSTRPGRSQAIISAGDGAAAAIDILSCERGEPIVDWDVPQ